MISSVRPLSSRIRSIRTVSPLGTTTPEYSGKTAMPRSGLGSFLSSWARIKDGLMRQNIRPTNKIDNDFRLRFTRHIGHPPKTIFLEFQTSPSPPPSPRWGEEKGEGLSFKYLCPLFCQPRERFFVRKFNRLANGCQDNSLRFLKTIEISDYTD